MGLWSRLAQRVKRLLHKQKDRTMAEQKKIAIAANKWWEADPLCAVLQHEEARPREFSNLEFRRYPKDRTRARGRGDKPRAMWPADSAQEARLSFEVGNCSVEVWCIEELMNPESNGSSSAEKNRVLEYALERSNPDLVIAFGTAGSAENVSINGSVVIGTRVFIHNPPSRSRGGWDPGKHGDEVIKSAFETGDRQIGRVFTDTSRFNAEVRMLRSPLHPAETPVICVGDGFVSVGVVNITNYDDYAWADRQAISKFEEHNIKAPSGQVGCIETTHGLIRCMRMDTPFIYVSGIADMEGLFAYHVTPRKYAQNFVAAHNAAVALAWMLPDVAGSL
jgi:hypothetical protein